MPICPVCKSNFPDGEVLCTNDWSVLVADGTPPSSPPPIGVSMPGGVLDGRYRLLGKVGEGGVGTVYKAEHLWMRRPVAIKFLHRKVTSSAEVVKRFAREARLSGQIQNPHCVSVFDFARAPDGTFYLVMEYIHGESLRDLFRREKAISLSRAAPIFEQLITALGAAHMVGIVHRDVKPENVMLQPDGDSYFVKILDFGIARRWTAFSDASRDLTVPGRTLGTPEYMAPEQAMGQSLDGRADLYAVGCLLFEALAGRRPYPQEDPITLMRAHVNEPIPKLQSIPGLKISSGADFLLKKALAKKPEERFPDAAAFVESLRLTVSLAKAGR
jgi:eukaryotic-like serine/threonine-protein kinase